MHTAQLIDRYCAAWSDSNPTVRRDLLKQVWAEGASYTDPTVHANGTEALLAHIARVQTGRPGARVLRTSELDVHHGVVRFAWRALDAKGVTLRHGIDFAFLSPQGDRIERIVGFFGDLAPLPAE